MPPDRFSWPSCQKLVISRRKIVCERFVFGRPGDIVASYECDPVRNYRVEAHMRTIHNGDEPTSVDLENADCL